MEPPIQYAQTKDGVRIAYWTMGEGPPVVHMPWGTITHIQLEAQHPDFRRWYERLARERRLVRYDSRGHGLSDRDVVDRSLDTYLQDVEGVVDDLGLERFALIGATHTGPVAITYSVRHPEQVSHLILWCSFARASDYVASELGLAVRGLIGPAWETFTETAAHFIVGRSSAESARRIATLMRESVTPEAMQAALAATSEFDVTDLLPQVKSPTLVLCPRQMSWPDLNATRYLASRIPGARLVVVEGEATVPHSREIDAAAGAIDEFLGEGEEAEATPAPSGLVTILFTDVEGSTALTDRLGDTKARELLRQHERMVREALKSHGGSEVKTMGDGFMASFSSATKALECAIAMQRAFAEANESAPEPIKVRVGLNAGEPIAEDEDLFGASVNRAARIASAANGGEILVANVVRELAEGKQFMFGDRGETALRGFDDPVRLFELRWRE